MEKRLMRQQLLGALFVLVTGTALHFVYGWSGGHPVAGALSAVNESVWEHMKLVFVPLFFLTLGEVFFLGRQWPNFLVSRAISTLVGTALVPVLYYTYTGIVGTHTLWADILVFILAVLAAFVLEGLLLRRGKGRLLPTLPAEALMIVGYWVFDGILTGSLLGAAVGIPSNLMQAAFGIAAFWLLSAALGRSSAMQKEFPAIQR